MKSNKRPMSKAQILLRLDFGIFCFGTDVQADGGDAAGGVVSDGTFGR